MAAAVRPGSPQGDALARWFPHPGPVQRYVELLGSTGVAHGLIGPREVPRLWDRHVLNCAAVLELVPTDVRILDVGSGAGLPGLVLALARPQQTVVLLEPLERRVAWLDGVVHELGLDNVEVVRGRAEDLGDRFGVVTSRAVAPIERLAGWCAPLVDQGGAMLAIKGRSAQQEVAEHAALLVRLFGVAPQVLTVGGDVLATPTTVVSARRTRPSSPAPRRRPRGRR